MAGERVLLIDESAAVQDMAKAALEENGYRVTTASNGLAALSHPDLEQFDLILIDSSMEGLDGLETTRFIKTDSETHQIPVLLLVPEEELSERSNQSLRGAVGYLAKPFTPMQITTKAREAILDQQLRNQAEQYLTDASERHMNELAEHKIQQAVERKIQIIVERAIQSIVSIIDQRAKREVDARVTALVSDKEQALVKVTVQEVARSMIEKLAERKVTEAMEQILVAQTEKTVKRAVDTMLPGMIRDRLRESIENNLPREIQTRVDKAAMEKAQEIGEGVVVVIQQQAQKIVPLVAKEKLPEIAERAIAVASESKIPQLVQTEARAAVANELNSRIAPMIEDRFQRLSKRVYAAVLLLAIVTLAAVIMAFVVPTIQKVITGDDVPATSTPVQQQQASPAATPAAP
ncbi:MAG: response regulator [Candidatus Sumerlaeia bacterium]|nr:response regulator [Candidatus Sumerlaeia bacterium]